MKTLISLFVVLAFLSACGKVQPPASITPGTYTTSGIKLVLNADSSYSATWGTSSSETGTYEYQQGVILIRPTSGATGYCQVSETQNTLTLQCASENPDFMSGSSLTLTRQK